MLVEISHDDVVGDVAGGGREVAALPEALSPVTLSDVFELLLDLAPRAPLGTTHEVADRDVRRDFNEHVHVIARQGAIHDGHVHLITDLLDDLAHTQPHPTVQNLIPVLPCPDEMVAMMKGRVTA